jgi:hypothetical protein
MRLTKCVRVFQINEGGFSQPPEIRNLLLSLHGKAHEIISGEFQHDTDMGMFDLAWELEDELSNIIEKFGGILKVKSNLTDLSPSLVDNQDEDMVG